MMKKTRYKGLFNYHNELEKIYAYAFTPEQAKIIMCRRLSKKHGVLPKVVYHWLLDHPNSYEIKIEGE
jgi:hypothetical protein